MCIQNLAAGIETKTKS